MLCARLAAAPASLAAAAATKSAGMAGLGRRESTWKRRRRRDSRAARRRRRHSRAPRSDSARRHPLECVCVCLYLGSRRQDGPNRAEVGERKREGDRKRKRGIVVEKLYTPSINRRRLESRECVARRTSREIWPIVVCLSSVRVCCNCFKPFQSARRAAQFGRLRRLKPF